MTLDLCRALCACGCGFEIDALDAPMETHAPASPRAGAVAGPDEPRERQVGEADEIAPASGGPRGRDEVPAPRGRDEPPAPRGSTPPAPAAYASDRTPRR